MSAPTANSPLGITILSRSDTYGNNHLTWHPRAKRAFLKWVCKHELYGNLYPHRRVHMYNPEFSWIEWHRGPAKYTYGRDFSRGYPDFEASRSLARDYWEKEFNKHLKAADEARWEARGNRERSLDRILATEHKPTRNFFKFMHAATAIAAR